MKIFSLIGKSHGVDIALCQKRKKIKKQLCLTNDQFKNSEIVIYAKNERTYIKNRGVLNFTSYATPDFCCCFEQLKKNHIEAGFLYV